MTDRVVGHGAKCCGECELCAPAPAPKKRWPRLKPDSETVLFSPIDDEEVDE